MTMHLTPSRAPTARAAGRRWTGGLIDRSTTVPFTFDGRTLSGHPGDTLASALLANGVRLVGRSFKYHRPRGILTAGPEEPNALVELRSGARREPNTRATVAELYPGLDARSQNRWPSLALDLMAVNSLAAPILHAGFYYKTFMWPAAFWEAVYEPLIRRAAGLGRAARAVDPDVYERAHLFCDVLVVGSGPAGLMAALAAARSGARVVLCEQDFRLGGRLLSETTDFAAGDAASWVTAAEGELAATRTVRVLRRTTVFGIFDHGECAAVERVSDHLPEPSPHAVRQRYWKIVARRIVLAAGAIERPMVFAGNDRPGVMTASAVRSYINRYGVVPGSRAVVLGGCNDAQQTAEALRLAGASVEAIIEPHQAPARSRDWRRMAGARIVGTRGRLSLSSVEVAEASGKRERIPADLIAMAGGWDPTLHLTCHLGGRPAWDETISAFVPGSLPPGLQVAGAAAGRFSLQAAFEDGAREGRAAAEAAGFKAPAMDVPQCRDAPAYEAPAFWQVEHGGAKAFIDFQNDVTADDIALASREGYRRAEHAKRYTTLGMATDQGKTSGVNGIAALAAVNRDTIARTGTTVYRPPYTPVAIGAIAGHERGRMFRPSRLTPTNDWAREQGAVFVEVGAWYRAQWYPKPNETDWLQSVSREAAAVRASVGVCDVSTLGKIEVTGPDAGRMLDFIYANTFSTLPVGKVRYGVMLREDGHVLDDGTVARFAADRYFLTTTTAHADKVLRHMEFCHQVLRPELDVSFLAVTDCWAQLAIAGPKSRDVLAAIVDGFDLATAAFPHMGAAELTVCGGVPARLYRLSFSGELAYELGVRADFGDAVIRRIMAAGAPFGITPYGTEAMTVLRVEKGFAASGELNGQTTAADLGLAGLLSSKKDFVGRAASRLPALARADRPALVSFKPVDPQQQLNAGAHFLAPGARAETANDQGYMTSVAYSPTLASWIGLGMLRDGPRRIGETVRAYDPVRKGDVEVIVHPACQFDPTGARPRV
ncbi:MAG: sarcosine oxidase subunit alpha family protein [Vicinamibacterales bacterium]